MVERVDEVAVFVRAVLAPLVVLVPVLLQTADEQMMDWITFGVTAVAFCRLVILVHAARGTVSSVYTGALPGLVHPVFAPFRSDRLTSLVDTWVYSTLSVAALAVTCGGG